MTTSTTSWDQVRAAFQQIWGYPDFRPPQGEIVQSLLQQRDTLIILPTGGGKSICFQLPALLQTGLTLVVSPLVALMENQVQELRQKNLPAATLHGELPTWERKQILWKLERGQLRLLYLSPETLLSPAVWQRLCQPTLRINGLILDEAHCLVQWGEVFRPAYYRLGAVRSALLQARPVGSRIAIAAFTATADPQAQQTIQQVLQLQDPQVFRLDPYRPNLALAVQVVWTPRGRRQRLLQAIQAKPGQAGLVYVRTRRDSETLATWLQQQGFRVAAYHAGLSPEERRQLEANWLTDRLQFVVCTSAFGMGINKPNVQWVIHVHAPLMLSEYVQEVGRAGRNGKPASALTLISEPTGLLDGEDQQRRRFFEHQQQKHQRSAQALAHKLPTQGDVASVSRQFKDSAIALSLLYSSGRLDWVDPFQYAIRPGKGAAIAQSNHHAARQMLDYLNTRECRWRFLLRAFGFSSEAENFRCGHCDRCDR
jgi:ATP-dependent DNA helicase RecQ